MENCIKVSFTGDIMAEKNWMDRNPENTDFSKTFKPVYNLFDGSDLVIGNLETVLAGRNEGYTDHIYSFNSPDSLVEELKKMDIDIVSLANNHILDRGSHGLERTIKILNENGIKTTGAFLKEEREQALIVEVGGVKLALIAYTQSTNYKFNQYMLSYHEKEQLNLLDRQDRGYVNPNKKGMGFKIKRKILSWIGIENHFKLKEMMGRPHNTVVLDSLAPEGIDKEILDQIKSDIAYAKKNADMVIFAPHMGGQFNGHPGSFAEFYMNFLAGQGVDMVVGNHPHIVQKYEKIKDSFAFYSLGNFSMDPSSIFVVADDKPEYGLVVHAYIDRDKKSLTKLSYSLVKMIYESNTFKVVDINYLKATMDQDSLLEDLNFINEKVTGKRDIGEILDEYVIYEE